MTTVRTPVLASTSGLQLTLPECQIQLARRSVLNVRAVTGVAPGRV